MSCRSGHIVLFFLLLAFYAHSQQEQLYTQFMFNKQEFNPAAAAYDDAFKTNGTIRSQWLGLDGAPETQKLGFQLPAWDEQLGLGFSLIRHTIGITKRVTASAMYNYRFPLGDGYLSIGLSTKFGQLEIDFSDDRLVATQGIDPDPVIDRQRYDQLSFNFGTGLFFHQRNFYVGLAAPSILDKDVKLSDELDLSYMEQRHIYFMTGYDWEISDGLSVVPQLMLRSTANSPLSWDFNVNAWFEDRLFGGLTYRSLKSDTGGGPESIDLLAGVIINDKIMLSISYDFSLSDLRKYQDGSLEINAIYTIWSPLDKKYVNPRFF